MSFIISSKRPLNTKPKDSSSYLAYSDSTLASNSTRPPYSLQFNGTTSYCQINEQIDILKASQRNFTIDCWIKIDSYPSTFVGSIFSNRNAGGYLLCVAGLSQPYPKTISFDLNISTGTRRIYGATILQLGIWYHIAATLEYRASNTNIGKVYVNGALDASSSSMSNIDATSTSQPYLGFEVGAPVEYHFTGKIYNFRYWTRALTQQEIISNANIVVGQDPSLLLDYSKYNNDSTFLRNNISNINANMSTTSPVRDIPSIKI